MPGVLFSRFGRIHIGHVLPECQDVRHEDEQQHDRREVDEHEQVVVFEQPDEDVGTEVQQDTERVLGRRQQTDHSKHQDEQHQWDDAIASQRIEEDVVGVDKLRKVEMH